MKQFSNHEQLPTLTPLGYKLTRIPPPWLMIIKDLYDNLTQLPPDKEELTTGMAGTQPEFYNLDKYPNIVNCLHNDLTPIMEEWCEESLIPTNGFGIRSYRHGTTLGMHVDRLATHHISAIFMCAFKGKDWPLKFIDNNGKENDIFMQSGDMLLYESCKCLHGRPKVFEGEFYRNFYLHWKLKDWEYLDT